LSLPQRLTEPSGKEAELYRQLPNGKIQCTACARLCQIGEGQVGLCGIRGVVGGKLYLLAYGRVMAGHIDPIEKKPVVHYKPGSKIFSIATSGCNWLCHPAGTKILLSNGVQKNVEDLLPGDSVWSYNIDAYMKIRPNIVTHTASRVARVWEIRYGKNRNNRLFLTEEHPVLTRSGWKKTNDITTKDEIPKVWYQNTPKWKSRRGVTIEKALFRCGRCSAKIIGLDEWNRHRGECYTRGLEKSPELLASNSRRMKDKDPMRDLEVVKKALALGRERFLIDPTYGWHKNTERLRTWLHRHPSASQKVLYQILDELGIDYEREFRITLERRLPESKQTYIADAALTGVKLDVEVDGWWHYRNEGVVGDDKVRDATLRLNGWEVLRISVSYLFNHREEAKALIVRTAMRPIMVNKRKWLQVTSVGPTERFETVFSLETIPDHNYVADQVVVHNCRYCQNYDISQRRRVEGIEAGPEDIVARALEYGCEGLAYTYNQPTIFMEYARDVGVAARKKGLFNIFVSNGYDTPETVSLMDSFLDCITVDFKGSGETEFVRKYIGIPNADPIFRTLLDMKQKTKVHIEITDLIIPGAGDSLVAAEKLCSWVRDNLGPETPVHFLRFHPDYKMMDFPHTPVETLEKHYEIGKKVGLNYVYVGNVPGHPAESTYCPGCGKVLIGRFSYEILEYNLDKNDRCRFCGYETPIIGPLSKSFRDERFIPVIN